MLHQADNLSALQAVAHRSCLLFFVVLTVCASEPKLHQCRQYLHTQASLCWQCIQHL